MRRWEASVAGLASAELDRGLANMPVDDYTIVRRQLMAEGRCRHGRYGTD